MENAKQPEAFNTAENQNRVENRHPPQIGSLTSIFSYTQEFKVDGWRSYMLKFLDSYGLLIFMLIVTTYALFSDDVRVSAFSKSADDVFFGLSTCAMFIFAVEMSLSFMLKPDYRWSFYFWLDLIATLSIIPDIGWAWDKIIGIGSSSNSSSNVSQLQGAAKSSRAGARAARVIKIVRLVRLMRIAKIYKHAKNAAYQKNNEQVNDSSNLQIPRESRVGRILSDLLTKRVIILVMVILILIPLFDLEFFDTGVTSWDIGLEAINKYELSENNRTSDESLRDYYLNYFDDSSRPVIYIAFDSNSEWNTSTKPSELREIEKYYAHYSTKSVAIYDIRIDTRLDAILNICKTVFVCIVLVSAAIFFTKDANDLAIIPIEKMIIKVKKMAENPLKIAEERVVDVYDIMEENTKPKWYDCICKKKKTNDYEPAVLENTFVKIGILLALGFGEAGAQIISSNIRSGGDVDPLIKGQKIAAIFGFCDIRNFTDATEELQEGVMLFVNELAKIVHSTVDHFSGAANKNIGDAFLVVWKFSSDQVKEFSNPIEFREDSQEITYLPDLALTAFLKIMVKVNKDPTILKYRSNPKLVKRMPGYQVKFGFGLHLGWAIEGAIGSIYKIDASYLSHHVNMSSNLEGLTKAYGIPLLLTDTVYSRLSGVGKSFCRQVDHVSLKGGREIYKLYTSDVDFAGLVPGRVKDYDKTKTKKKRNHLRFQLDQNLKKAEDVLSESKEIEIIKKPFSEEFFEMFQKGLDMYLAGKWTEAKELFEDVLRLRPIDGPSAGLIKYMEEFNFKAPEDWEGIRAIY